jgi:hypothetical protein
MFEITQKAHEMVKDYLKDREEVPSVRIFLSEGG